MVCGNEQVTSCQALRTIRKCRITQGHVISVYVSVYIHFVSIHVPRYIHHIQKQHIHVSCKKNPKKEKGEDDHRVTGGVTILHFPWHLCRHAQRPGSVTSLALNFFFFFFFGVVKKNPQTGDYHMHSRNGMFAKLSLLRELTKVQPEQEDGFWERRSQREHFGPILPRVSLRPLEDANHGQKSHLRHTGEKTHSGDPQDNHRHV